MEVNPVVRNRRRRQPPFTVPARSSKRLYALPLRRGRSDAASSLNGYKFRRPLHAGLASGLAAANASSTSHTARAGRLEARRTHSASARRRIGATEPYVPGAPSGACPHDGRIGACAFFAQVVESPPGWLWRTETVGYGASCPDHWEDSRCTTRDGTAKSNAPGSRGFGRACAHTMGERPLAESGGMAITRSAFADRRFQALWG